MMFVPIKQIVSKSVILSISSSLFSNSTVFFTDSDSPVKDDSPKYKSYQQNIRSKQLERAQKIVDGQIKRRKGKNQNDPARFVKETACTNEGEIAEKTTLELDQERIEEEKKYDFDVDFEI